MTHVQRCRYAIVKYAHDPLRQEPLNVGVVIWPVANPQDAQWRFDGTMKRVERLYPSAQPRAVRTALAVFKNRVERDPTILLSGASGSAALMLTEPRAVHCADIDVELKDLFDTLVAPSEVDVDEPRERTRSSRFIKGRMNEMFKSLGVLAALSGEQAQGLRIVRCASGVKHTFDFAYQNGSVHRIDALSFDHGTNPERLSRARSFANLVVDVVGGSGSSQLGEIQAVIQIPTDPIEMDIYQDAKRILDTLPQIHRVEVRDDADLEAFCETTKAQLRH